MGDRETIEELKGKIRTIPDFPKPGILFYDITTLLKDPGAFQKTVDLLAHPWLSHRPDYILGIDARGFILASALAYKLHTGLVVVRKKGKLPFKTESVRYALEYGYAEIEIHVDAVENGKKVLIVDDLLATGGTAQATVELVKKTGGIPIGCAFVIELMGLSGRDRLLPLRVESLLTFPA
jgi:adenine phosphoribosyltransferase